MEIIMLLAFSLPVVAAFAFAIPRKSTAAQPMRKQMILAGLHMLLIATSIVVGLAMVGAVFAYAHGKEDEGYNYRAYLRIISSYAYVAAQKPNSPCVDPAHFMREFRKGYRENSCVFSDVTINSLPLFGGPELTISFRNDFAGAMEVLARDLDRRCNILAELGTTVQQVLSRPFDDDCLPGAFHVEQRSDHVAIRVTRNPWHHNGSKEPLWRS